MNNFDYVGWRAGQKRMNQEKREAMIEKVVVVVFLVLLGLFVLCSSGCAVKSPGTRTFQFGPDGTTITSETTTAEPNTLADIEKEKSVQKCWTAFGKIRTAIADAAESNPLVLAMVQQSDSINNIVSLAFTKKPYNPCPSSTNSSDVEIADAEMYSNIYREGAGVLKFALGSWAATDISDNLFGALGKAGAYTFAASGEGSSISVSDAFKSSVFGDGATTNDVLSNPSFVTEMLEQQ